MLGFEGNGNASVGSGGGVVAVSAYMGGTRVLSSACDVLEMSVVRGVGGVCEICKCVDRGGVGREWETGLGLGFTNSGETWYMCVLVAVVWVVLGGGSGWAVSARVWEGGVVLCLCVL